MPLRGKAIDVLLQEKAVYFFDFLAFERRSNICAIIIRIFGVSTFFYVRLLYRFQPTQKIVVEHHFRLCRLASPLASVNETVNKFCLGCCEIFRRARIAYAVDHAAHLVNVPFAHNDMRDYIVKFKYFFEFLRHSVYLLLGKFDCRFFAFVFLCCRSFSNELGDVFKIYGLICSLDHFAKLFIGTVFVVSEFMYNV